MVQSSETIPQAGFKAPDFNLLDVVRGEQRTLAELKGSKATVVMFICNHCPYVKLIMPAVVRLARAYAGKGVAFVGISANDALHYPDDGPEQMKKLAVQDGYPFAYLYDESQETAKAYMAECTPEFYVFDGQLQLAYHGQFDDARPNSGITPAGTDLSNALENILNELPAAAEARPAIGCSIKWKN